MCSSPSSSACSATSWLQLAVELVDLALRVGEVAEEARVLDGDRGLLGEVADERHVGVAERAGAQAVVDVDAADDAPLDRERNGEHRAQLQIGDGERGFEALVAGGVEGDDGDAFAGGALGDAARERARGGAGARAGRLAMLRAASTRQAPAPSVSRMKPRSAEVRSRTVSRMRSSRTRQALLGVEALVDREQLAQRLGSGRRRRRPLRGVAARRRLALGGGRIRRRRAARAGGARRDRRRGVATELGGAHADLLPGLFGAVEAGERAARMAPRRMWARAPSRSARKARSRRTLRVARSRSRASSARRAGSIGSPSASATRTAAGSQASTWLAASASVRASASARCGAALASLGFGERLGEVERGGEAIAGGSAGERRRRRRDRRRRAPARSPRRRARSPASRCA